MGRGWVGRASTVGEPSIWNPGIFLFTVEFLYSLVLKKIP